jgi:hypothetical protein
MRRTQQSYVIYEYEVHARCMTMTPNTRRDMTKTSRHNARSQEITYNLPLSLACEVQKKGGWSTRRLTKAFSFVATRCASRVVGSGQLLLLIGAYR